ncbi:MAG: hypothetical protein SGILL_009200 [Bacillariaceae sp.]
MVEPPSSVASGSIFDNAVATSTSFSYMPEQTSSSTLPASTSTRTEDYDYTVAQPPASSSFNLDERISTLDPSAICLTESPVLSSSSNKKFHGLTIDDFSDGDPISFAGRQFHFVDYSSPYRKRPAAENGNVPLKGDGGGTATKIAKGTNRNIFANETPLIVSDALLEPLSSNDFDSIFSIAKNDKNDCVAEDSSSTQR